MQPPVLRVDVQYPLPGNAHPFRRHGDEREDKALEPALHVNAGEDAAGLARQVQVEVLQHGGEEQEHRVVFQMVAPTKIDAEERKHNVTVLITIAGAADIETAVHQHGQSRALEFLHHIKNPAKGNDVLVFYRYLCHA